MLDELKTARKIVGVKQLSKALRRGEIAAVFLAQNADPMMTDSVRELAESLDVPVWWIPTMQELGTACRISVGAAAAGILK